MGDRPDQAAGQRQPAAGRRARRRLGRLHQLARPPRGATGNQGADGGGLPQAGGHRGAPRLPPRPAVRRASPRSPSSGKTKLMDLLIKGQGVGRTRRSRGDEGQGSGRGLRHRHPRQSGAAAPDERRAAVLARDLRSQGLHRRAGRGAHGRSAGARAAGPSALRAAHGRRRPLLPDGRRRSAARTTTASCSPGVGVSGGTAEQDVAIVEAAVKWARLNPRAARPGRRRPRRAGSRSPTRCRTRPRSSAASIRRSAGSGRCAGSCGR